MGFAQSGQDRGGAGGVEHADPLVESVHGRSADQAGVAVGADGDGGAGWPWAEEQGGHAQVGAEAEGDAGPHLRGGWWGFGDEQYRG
jgi:hypothetical protein